MRHVGISIDPARTSCTKRNSPHNEGQWTNHCYSRDAKLARYAVDMCPSVRLSVIRRYCIETAKQIELLLAYRLLSLRLYYCVLEWNSRILPAVALFRTLELEKKFATARQPSQLLSTIRVGAHYTARKHE